MWSVWLNGAMGFIMAVTMCFCLGDLSKIIHTPTGYPFIQLFFNATRSKAASDAMVTIMLIALTSGCLSETATTSRQLWSFARDKGLPLSYVFARVSRPADVSKRFLLKINQVSPTFKIPFNAIIASMTITCLVSLINIGSTVALNAIVSLGVVALLSSYSITIACLVWRRLWGEPLPPRRWSLGKYGLTINVISLLFLAPICFFAFWPLSIPVEPSTMNWAVVMFGGVMVWALVYYAVWARHSYTGPVAVVNREQ
ncbi:MAG: hypothetical protein LQ352_002375 [Teloschistes flavicans]|nr:MAG: hypothetical protein LQ352_002375 [Teloschistes flavicans]